MADKKKAKKKAAPKKAHKKAAHKKPAHKKHASKKAPVHHERVVSTAPFKAENKPKTKTQMIGEISKRRGLPRKEIASIFEDVEEIIKVELGRHKKFNFMGLVKMIEKKRPATKERKGINPFTGQETVFKAKPASKTVRAVALKRLKDMV
ncbi:MAG: HU family DNA-binding protein [Oligoflexales bacterium]|nr:HU family DNA-binding protein [Oligoflexales bacterium]